MGASRDAITTPVTSTITAVPSTGTGSAYASSCNVALIAWGSASLSWQWANAFTETSTDSSKIEYTSYAPGTTKITSLITLCDGYPRVVGHISTSQGAQTPMTESYTNTYTQTIANSAYPTPPPCSIQPSDCKSMSSAFNSLVSKEGSLTGAAPQCSIPYPTPSYSMGSNNQTCDNCLIVASTARLMYWPVTTKPGVGNLCYGRENITPSPTGTAPISFVTDGITITSPTVAISFGYMSRADDCGPTIDHTIIPVRPEEVTSVNGFRALFSHHQFNFADLNWHCMSTNTTNFTLDATANDDSCYQAVPASAYWGGLNNAAVQDQYVFRTMSKWQKTIYNDYQPQILPPSTMTEAIASIWGNSCLIHPDGVWDPPIALTPAATLDLPDLGPGNTDAPTTTISASPGFPFAPSPAVQTNAVSLILPTYSNSGEHFTALPENAASDDGSGQDGSGAPFTGAAGSGVGGVSYEPGSENSGSDEAQGGDGSSGSSGYSDAGPSNPSTSGGSDSSSDNSPTGAGLNAGSAQAMSLMAVGSSTCSVVSSASDVQVLAHGGSVYTISQGGPAATIDNQAVSLAPPGRVVIGTGAAASTVVDAAATNSPQTTVIVVNTKTITASRMNNGAWVLPDSSITGTALMGGDEVTVKANAIMTTTLRGKEVTVESAATFSAAATGLVRVGGYPNGSGGASGDDSSSSYGTGSRTAGPSSGTATGQDTTAGSGVGPSQSSDAAGRSSRVGSALGLVLGVAGLVAL